MLFEFKKKKDKKGGNLFAILDGRLHPTKKPIDYVNITTVNIRDSG